MSTLDYLVNLIYPPLTECSRQRDGQGQCEECEAWVREVLQGVLAGDPIYVGANQMEGPHGPICGTCGAPGVRESGSCLNCPPPGLTIDK